MKLLIYPKPRCRTWRVDPCRKTCANARCDVVASGESAAHRKSAPNHLFALFTALALALFAATPPVFAADGRRTITGDGQTDAAPSGPFHIGTIRTRAGDDHLPAQRNGIGVDDTIDTGVSPHQLPATLLADALDELYVDRKNRARRLLEILVVRYPNSAQADTARRHLVKLYAPEPSAGAANAGHSLDKGARPATGLRSGKNQRTVAPAPLPPVNKPLSRAMGLAVGDRVFFAPGSDKLGSKARAVLRRQAEWLKRRAGLSVLISGHADEAGGTGQNLALSTSRANAVRSRLIEEGIAQSRIQINALGRTQPIAQCAAPICAAQNRRVVTSILRASGQTIRAPTQRRARNR